MVNTRANASTTSKRKQPPRANASNGKGKAKEVTHGPLQDITDYVEKLKEAAAELAEQLQNLQEKNKELEDELSIEREAATLSQHTRRGSTPASIARLEVAIKELKKQNKKKDGIIAKMKAKELKAEAEDLLDTAPDLDTGEDMATKMRKLLRRYSDLMLVTTLGEEDDCSICMDRMVLKKCTALSCGHIFCNDCIKQILPRDEKYECPMCRTRTERDDFEEVYMTETQRWDDLLKVAQAWDAIDHRPVIDTSEEEGEDNFMTDASGDDETSRSDGEGRDASSGDLDEEEQEGTDGTSTPTSSPPPRLAYGASPTKEKRKRLAELAERASKRRR